MLATSESLLKYRSRGICNNGLARAVKKKKNRIYLCKMYALADLFLYPCTLPTAPVSMKNCVVVRAWPPKIPKKENYQVYPARVGILNFVSIN
jgi:hypothetical protein